MTNSERHLKDIITEVLTTNNNSMSPVELKTKVYQEAQKEGIKIDSLSYVATVWADFEVTKNLDVRIRG